MHMEVGEIRRSKENREDLQRKKRRSSKKKRRSPKRKTKYQKKKINYRKKKNIS